MKYATELGEAARMMLKLYPVYLVSPDTMDECMPPTLIWGTNPECIRELLPKLDEMLQKGIETEKEESYSPLDVFERLLSECSKRYVNLAMGVFLPNGCGKAGIGEEAILITPERVEEEAEEISQSYPVPGAFKHLFKAVLAHELGHAYSHEFARSPAIGGYTKYLGMRTLEETLAQLFAYVNIDETDRLAMTLESRRQSAEYRGWYLFKDSAQDTLKDLLKLYDLSSANARLAINLVRDNLDCYRALKDCIMRMYPSACRWYIRYCGPLYLHFPISTLNNVLLNNVSLTFEWSLLLSEIMRGTTVTSRDMARALGDVILLLGSIIDPKPFY